MKRQRQQNNSLVIDLSDVPPQPPISKSSGRVKEGASKYTGVCFNKKSNKWQAQINLDGKTRLIGYYDDEEDAAVGQHHPHSGVALIEWHHHRTLALAAPRRALLLVVASLPLGLLHLPGGSLLGIPLRTELARCESAVLEALSMFFDKKRTPLSSASSRRSVQSHSASVRSFGRSLIAAMTASAEMYTLCLHDSLQILN